MLAATAAMPVASLDRQRALGVGLLLLVTVFVAAERDEITKCTETCRCELATIDVSVAYCDPLRKNRT